MMLSSSTIFHYAAVPVFVIILVDYEAVLVRNYKLSKYANLDPNTFRPSFAPFGSNYALLDPCFASFWVHPPGECVSLQEAGGRPQSPWRCSQGMSAGARSTRQRAQVDRTADRAACSESIPVHLVPLPVEQQAAPGNWPATHPHAPAAPHRVLPHHYPTTISTLSSRSL